MRTSRTLCESDRSCQQVRVALRASQRTEQGIAEPRLPSGRQFQRSMALKQRQTLRSCVALSMCKSASRPCQAGRSDKWLCAAASRLRHKRQRILVHDANVDERSRRLNQTTRRAARVQVWLLRTKSRFWLAMFPSSMSHPLTHTAPKCKSSLKGPIPRGTSHASPHDRRNSSHNSASTSLSRFSLSGPSSSDCFCFCDDVLMRDTASATIAYWSACNLQASAVTLTLMTMTSGADSAISPCRCCTHVLPRDVVAHCRVVLRFRAVPQPSSLALASVFFDPVNDILRRSDSAPLPIFTCDLLRARALCCLLLSLLGFVDESRTYVFKANFHHAPAWASIHQLSIAFLDFGMSGKA